MDSSAPSPTLRLRLLIAYDGRPFRGWQSQATKDAVLPAWSLDGQHLAWFQRSGKKKFTLHYAWVSKG